MITTRDLFFFLYTCAICNYSITASQCGTDGQEVYFELVVRNSIKHDEVTYNTHVIPGGILLGGLRRLMKDDEHFTFTYTEHPDLGPYLESVNNVSGNPADHTYWELLVKKPFYPPVRLDVGIGCYRPEEGDQVIFNFTRW